MGQRAVIGISREEIKNNKKEYLTCKIQSMIKTKKDAPQHILLILLKTKDRILEEAWEKALSSKEQ